MPAKAIRAVWACSGKYPLKRCRGAHNVVGEMKKDGVEGLGDIGRLDRRLQQRDILPAGLGDPLPGQADHFGADFDADNLAFGANRVAQEREAQARAAGHVQDTVSGTQIEFLDCARAYPHRAPRRGIVAVGMIDDKGQRLSPYRAHRNAGSKVTCTD